MTTKSNEEFENISNEDLAAATGGARTVYQRRSEETLEGLQSAFPSVRPGNTPPIATVEFMPSFNPDVVIRDLNVCASTQPKPL